MIEEAVRYIEELHATLLERFRQQHGEFSLPFHYRIMDKSLTFIIASWTSNWYSLSQVIGTHYCIMDKSLTLIITSWTCHWPFIITSWICHWPFIIISWTCHWTSIIILWICHSPFIFISWTCTLTLHYHYRLIDTSLILHWQIMDSFSSNPYSFILKLPLPAGCSPKNVMCYIMFTVTRSMCPFWPDTPDFSKWSSQHTHYLFGMTKAL